MKIQKNVLVAGLLTTVAAGSVIGIGSVNALREGGSPHDNLIDKLSETFNLNRDQVEAVFDEHRTAITAEQKAMHERYLQSKVDDATLTAEQKTALSGKLNELHAAREEWRNQELTPEQMKEKMTTSWEELQRWAEEQGINLAELKLMGHDMHGMHGAHDGHRRGMGGTSDTGR